MPYAHIVLPALVGLFTCGLFMVALRSTLRSRSAGPPPAEAAPEYDPFVDGSRSEKRTAARRGGSRVAIHYQLDEKKGPPQEGWVRDRSVGGLCLILDEAFAAGTVLRVLPVNASSIVPWVDVEVRSCRQVGDDYELGCQFVKQPPWSVLLLFN